MTGKIDDEMIEYVGILAQLELSDEEKLQARDDMNRMLEYIDKLGNLDTEGVEPLIHIFSGENVFREDIVAGEADRESILENAPQVKNGQFVVPKTVG